MHKKVCITTAPSYQVIKNYYTDIYVLDPNLLNVILKSA
jgi:hypothetical protein